MLALVFSWIQTLHGKDFQRSPGIYFIRKIAANIAHEGGKLGLFLEILYVFLSAATAGQTESRWWRDMSRRLWVASPWSCSLKRSPPLMTTSWSSGSEPTPATRGSPNSGSTGFSVAFPDTHKRTWIMHETAQVAKLFIRQLWGFFGWRFYASVQFSLTFFFDCFDVCSAHRMSKWPINVNRLWIWLPEGILSEPI